MVVCTLMIPFAVLALGTAPQGDPDAQVATAIERALIEHACNVTDTSRALETDAQQQCLNARLLSLRTDFGRDLTRLPAADRKSIDATCGRLRTFERREVYVDCLARQLDAVRLRQNAGGGAAVPVDAGVAAVPSPVAAAAPPAPAVKASSWLFTTVIIGIAAVAIAAGGIVFAVRRRPARGRCRSCGASVSHADLCATCRHEAAQVLRHAVVERAHTEGAQEEEERRRRAHEPEQQAHRARTEEVARIKDEDLAHGQTDARERAANDAPVRVDGAVRSFVPAQEQAPDSYAVLGLASDASPEEIGAAYQEARSRYAPELVSHLGDDAQAHFKAKAEAIERAYQELTQMPLTARRAR
jgi:hypothetical protein